MIGGVGGSVTCGGGVIGGVLVKKRASSKTGYKQKV